MVFNIAWAAGLIEGEGCFTLHSDGKAPYFLMDMTDKDVLENFQKVFPNTNLRGPYLHKNKPKHKPRYRIDAYNNACKEIMQAVFPYLGLRRKAKVLEFMPELSVVKEVPVGYKLETDPARIRKYFEEDGNK